MSTNKLKMAAVALIPFTPVPLTGEGALYGWGRLALYGALTVMTFEKQRKLSYVFGAAAATSLLTSVCDSIWRANAFVLPFKPDPKSEPKGATLAVKAEIDEMTR